MGLLQVARLVAIKSIALHKAVFGRYQKLCQWLSCRQAGGIAKMLEKRPLRNICRKAAFRAVLPPLFLPTIRECYRDLINLEYSKMIARDKGNYP